ncbi:TPM domain-containing protein [Sphingomonas humi]|uniref:TPM domain-containing protein n=1 Tax=Sphingomonas humi TaxID=335630 RepID=A0ABP7S0P7_9SPHN
MLLALVLANPTSAQTFPKLTGQVVDDANLLDPAREAALTQQLQQLEQQTGRQLVVATIRSLEGRTIEDYGYRLGRTWGIGDKEEDDGVLLIVAPNERKVRIETGYGARVFLTDAVSSIIIRNAILPRFRDNDYPGGIEAGVNEIATQMQLPPAEAAKRIKDAEAQASTQRRGSGGAGFVPMVFWILVIAFVFLSFARRAGGRRYQGKRRRGGGIDPMVVLWGLDALSHAARNSRGGGGGGWGGGFGGGGGGFSGGGGSFGGGGASGSW